MKCRCIGNDLEMSKGTDTQYLNSQRTLTISVINVLIFTQKGL
ncbi:Uncharacterised protein [Porphyromonas macacae]|uniref:Uncharacterized protein n=1 Tax=Porphyromonas macacae TaxID=28115 RepID=A0A379EAH9_9PORP|nr:Uncharacterised protein [Porphyromonas macacae]